MAKPNTSVERNSRLGRGLSSLILNSAVSGGQQSTYTPVSPGEPHAAASVGSHASGRSVSEIPIQDIGPNPYQPRRAFGQDQLAELAASIKREGVLQPLLVCRAGEQADQPYLLIAGERRLKAAVLAGLGAVPCIVREASAAQMLEWALVENIQRVDLNPIERALGYQRYIDAFSLTQAEVAHRVGQARATVANHLRLLDLCDEIQEMLAEGALSLGHGKVLAALVGEPGAQLQLGRKAVAEGLSVRRVEKLLAIAKGREGKGDGKSRASCAKPAYLVDLEERLCQRVGTRVRILPGRAKHSGRVVVDYYSLDDFDRIAALLGLAGDE